MQKQEPIIFRTIRAFEWWEHKLSPLFATIYATALLLDVAVLRLWPLLLVAFVALVPGASYVSVINDLTDMQDDLASGKKNRLAGRSRGFIALAVACCVLPGVAVSLYWRHDALLLALYLAAWAAFSLYSLPPVRLKKRGALGPLADASGAHLFPTLLVVCLVFRWSGAPLDLLWLVAVAVWSLCFGLRGILWHQLCDLRHDEKVGLRTFARQRTVEQLRALGNYLIFPAEVASFALMLWHSGSRAALALLCLYALLEAARKVRWRMSLVVVVPKQRYRILMHEYYEVFYPLGILLSSALRHPTDALLIVIHLLLFPRRAAQTAKDIVRFLRQGASKLLRQRGGAAA